MGTNGEKASQCVQCLSRNQIADVVIIIEISIVCGRCGTLFSLSLSLFLIHTISHANWYDMMQMQLACTRCLIKCLATLPFKSGLLASVKRHVNDMWRKKIEPHSYPSYDDLLPFSHPFCSLSSLILQKLKFNVHWTLLLIIYDFLLNINAHSKEMIQPNTPLDSLDHCWVDSGGKKCH